ncbi:MAG: hypothetical protein WCB36_01520 [Burkholderiales bacterium]
MGKTNYGYLSVSATNSSLVIFQFMKKRAMLIAVVVALFVVSIGIAVLLFWPMLSLWLFLATLNLSAPEQDAAKALADGRPICYSVNGYSRHFPGVKTDAGRQFCQGVEINIAGTADAMIGSRHALLDSQANQYAARFNTQILLVSKVVNE